MTIKQHSDRNEISLYEMIASATQFTLKIMQIFIFLQKFKLNEVSPANKKHPFWWLSLHIFVFF